MLVFAHISTRHRQLSFPAVPAKIPDEVTALAGLTNLQIIGDTNIPGA